MSKSQPPTYLTDRVKDFKKIWRAYFLKNHPAYPAIEAFLTETIEQSIEMGRREGYEEGWKDCKEWKLLIKKLLK